MTQFGKAASVDEVTLMHLKDFLSTLKKNVKFYIFSGFLFHLMLLFCSLAEFKDRLYYNPSESEEALNIFFFLDWHDKRMKQHWSSILKPSRSSVPLSRRDRLVSVTSVPLDSSSPLHTGRLAQPSQPVRSSSQGDTGGRPPASSRQANLTRVIKRVKKQQE